MSLAERAFVPALLLAAVVWFTASLLIAAPQGAPATTYYIAPSGDDAGDGSVTSPWRTLAFAVRQLAPGDTLYLRAGTYYEHAVEIRARGTAEAPITIAAYPGEQVSVEGGVPFFKSAPNDEWEPLDQSIGLYRSRRALPRTANLGGWLLEYDVQLLHYLDLARLRSTDYSSQAAYIGPGIHQADDGRVYIRLQQNPRDALDRAGRPLPPVPADTDPRQVRIGLFANEEDEVLRLRGASHLVLRDLAIGPSRYGLDIDDGSHHITISGCAVRFQNAGIIAREGTRALTVEGCELTMGFPQWIYWGDIKGSGDNPAYAGGWNAFGIAGTWRDSRIERNLLRDCFDGIFLESGSANTLLADNVILEARDDAISLQADIANIEVARNIIRHSFEGIGLVGGAAHPPGDVYLHHNIIEVAAYHRAERPGDFGDFGAVWSPGVVFGLHDCDQGCERSQWRIYNNTIAARPTRYGLTPEMQNHVMYNNLILMIGSRPFERLRHSAGNLFWRTSGGLSGFAEPHGLEVNPGFDLALIDAPTTEFGAAAPFTPSNPLALSPGQPYDGLAWPGTSGVSYRGAVSGSVCFLPFTRVRMPIAEVRVAAGRCYA